jgi:hypothetical protein
MLKSWQVPVGSLVMLVRTKKAVKTTGTVIAHWDDDNENPSYYRSGLMIDMHGFTCGKVVAPRKVYRMIQREDGSYFPCAEWGSKVGSLTLEVML